MRDILSTIRKLTFALALGAMAGRTAFSPAAEAAGVLERGIWLSGPRYDGAMRPCDEALGTITQQFAEKEGKFWNSALEITGYANVHEVAFRAWANNSIPRRFCTASAMLTDGRARQVHFSIIEDGGFAGFDSGVEWCVVGLDRNWAYNPSCKAARP
ncbi:MAG TPA: hypothetical protein VF460_00200 [Burkholderiales bacterium]